MTHREAVVVFACAVALVVGAVIALAGAVGALVCGLALGAGALLAPERPEREHEERP